MSKFLHGNNLPLKEHGSTYRFYKRRFLMHPLIPQRFFSSHSPNCTVKTRLYARVEEKTAPSTSEYPQGHSDSGAELVFAYAVVVIRPTAWWAFYWRLTGLICGTTGKWCLRSLAWIQSRTRFTARVSKSKIKLEELTTTLSAPFRLTFVVVFWIPYGTKNGKL